MASQDRTKDFRHMTQIPEMVNRKSFYGTVRVTSASPVSCFVFSVSHELGSSEHLHPIPMLEHQQPALAEILAL